MRLKNRVAIVTGAASGMGEAIVKRFLEEGAKVVGFSLEQNCSIEHDDYIYVSGDVTKPKDCERVLEVAMEKFGKLDCLVNSAGITVEGNLENIDIDMFKRTFDINVFGIFNMCKAAIGEMKKRKSTIVNISSNMGVKALKDRVAYNPSKAAVNMLTECIALDYAENVRANTVMPGIVDTPMIQNRLNKSENKEQLMKMYESIYPLKRIGKVEDIVNAVLFLSTDDSDWMTGSHLPVCGGDQL